MALWLVPPIGLEGGPINAGRAYYAKAIELVDGDGRPTRPDRAPL